MLIRKALSLLCSQLVPIVFDCSYFGSADVDPNTTVYDAISYSQYCNSIETSMKCSKLSLFCSFERKFEERKTFMR